MAMALMQASTQVENVRLYYMLQLDVREVPINEFINRSCRVINGGMNEHGVALGALEPASTRGGHQLNECILHADVHVGSEPLMLKEHVRLWLNLRSWRWLYNFMGNQRLPEQLQ